MLDPEVPDERREEIAVSARRRIEEGATLKQERTWGTRKMSYEIDQRNEADYRFFRFENGKGVLDDLNHNLKITDGVLRFRIFKVDPRAPVIDPPAPLCSPPAPTARAAAVGAVTAATTIARRAAPEPEAAQSHDAELPQRRLLRRPTLRHPRRPPLRHRRRGSSRGGTGRGPPAEAAPAEASPSQRLPLTHPRRPPRRPRPLRPSLSSPPSSSHPANYAFLLSGGARTRRPRP